MLAVVVADVEVEGEYEFERCRFSTSPEHLRLLAEWLIEKQVEEVVMEFDGAILEAGLGSAGTVLDAYLQGAGRYRPDVGGAPSGAGAVQSRATGAQERLSRR